MARRTVAVAENELGLAVEDVPACDPQCLMSYLTVNRKCHDLLHSPLFG